jgi:hypothetical protein
MLPKSVHKRGKPSQETSSTTQTNLLLGKPARNGHPVALFQSALLIACLKKIISINLYSLLFKYQRQPGSTSVMWWQHRGESTQTDKVLPLPGHIIAKWNFRLGRIFFRALLNDCIYKTKLDCLLTTHPVVALHHLPDAILRLASMPSDDAIQSFACIEDFLRMNCNIAGLSTCPADRLVKHQAGIRKC